jgi:DegV family protein with EDD domain
VGVRIVTDSTAYLKKELLEEYDITVVPLTVNFSDISFPENEISNEKFYAMMDKSEKVPTSSQPSPHNLKEAFRRIVGEGHDVVGIFISSVLSGIYNAALAAKTMVLDEYPEAVIEIIDSKVTTMQMGYAVLAAARAAARGAGWQEAADAAREVNKKSRLLFVPKTLEYLRKGGRIGEASALIGTLLQIKPILTLVDGRVTVLDKVRTMEKAWKRILELFWEDVKQRGIGEVTVHHINCEDQVREIAAELEAGLGIKVPTHPIGPVIGIHAGPGTLGIAYYTRE